MLKRKQAKNRWIYIATILDLQIYDMILASNTNIVVFDKKEITDPIIKRTKDLNVRTFLINQAVEDELTKIIKEKKNRHIIYVLRNSKPIEILRKELQELITKVSPNSNFYYNLVCDNESLLGHDDFYAVYCVNEDANI